MILADTSIWVDHLRGQCPEMARLLSKGQIAMHPYIVAEIALGSLHNRRQRLAEMEALLEVRVAQLDEVRYMIEAHTLFQGHWADGCAPDRLLPADARNAVVDAGRSHEKSRRHAGNTG